MRFCAICSKKLNLFNARKGIRLKSGEEICLSCSNKLDADTLSNIGNMEKYEFIGSVFEKDKIKKYCCICHKKMTVLNTSLLLKNPLKKEASTRASFLQMVLPKDCFCLCRIQL